MAESPSTHWLVLYDPDDGEPYGQVCRCEVGVDHNGYGDPLFLDREDGGGAMAVEVSM